MVNNTLLYACTTLFTHSSVDGHVGHVHLLAIVNGDAMNTNVQKYKEMLIPVHIEQN